MPSEANSAKTDAEPEDKLSQPLLVTVSPHIRSPELIPRIMWTVSATLTPAAAWGVYVFGPRAIWVMALGIVSAVAAEAGCQALRRRPIAIRDGSAFLTGLLVAFVLPVHVPWYVPVTASVFAIAVVKQAFGGLGCNIWNPALMGRAFVLAAWAALVTAGAGWPEPFWYLERGGAEAKAGAAGPAVDATTAATPLTKVKEGLRELNTQVKKEVGKSKGRRAEGVEFPCAHEQASAALRRVQDEQATEPGKLFFGLTGGCVGEVSALALLAGGIALIAVGYVKWQVPVFYIGTVALLAWVLPTPVAGAKVAYSPEAGALVVKGATTYLVGFAGRPLFAIFAGGLFLGAFFMATDMVTSPVTKKGVCYAILLMNTATPLIDRYTKPKVFGQRPKT